MKLKLVFLFALSLFLSNGVKCQENLSTWELNKDFNIKVFAGFQIWSTYTIDQQIFDGELATYKLVNNRFNTQLRRSRIGIKGQPYKNITFNLTGALDLVGRDLLSATIGGANNGSSPSFRLWNAYVQWRLKNNSEKAFITIGYLVPQIGRESMTSALRVSSIEKSISQFYIRKQLTGIGPGRAMGINLGGQLIQKSNLFSLSYDFGIFNPLYVSLQGNSLGYQPSLLGVGRVVMHIGDPEHKTYSISHKVNYDSQRFGASVALAYAYQGKSDIFDSNNAVGIDWLVNWGAFNFDGEWMFLSRTGHDERQTFSSKSQTGYFRTSFNYALPNHRILEPTIMVSLFNGAMKNTDQIKSGQLNTFAGHEVNLDFGVNFHLNKDLKIQLHYVINNGDSGESMITSPQFNNYFFQSGVGAIKRGNWVGLGLISLF